MIRTGFLLSLLLAVSCVTDPDNSPDTPPSGTDTLSQAQIDSIRQSAIAAFLDSVQQTLGTRPEPLADLYERACEGVYVVVMLDEEGNPFGHGTAFLVGQSGILVTNAHVVEPAAAFIVLDRDRHQYEVDSILHFDREWDNAVIRIKPPFHGGVVLPLATAYPRIGEESFTIGAPLGLEQTISTGIISGFRDSIADFAPIRPRGNILQTTTEIAPGSSGGPLFNRRGEVIGITTATAGTANLNFAISIRAIPLEAILGKAGNDLPAGLPTTPSGTRVRQALDTYFAALIDGDRREIRPCYAPTVNRYYQDYGLSAQEAADADTERRWNGTWTPVRYLPDWDRAALSALADGVELTIPVIYQGMSSGEVEDRELDYRFEFDTGYRIRKVVVE